MKLEFLLIPTSDLNASLALYRDSFGFTELWREGESTAALLHPDSAVQIMLDASDPEAPVGPIFVVDSVPAFHASRPAGLTVLAEPAEIPGGAMASYRDAGGGVVHVLDQAADS